MIILINDCVHGSNDVIQYICFSIYVIVFLSLTIRCHFIDESKGILLVWWYCDVPSFLPLLTKNWLRNTLQLGVNFLFQLQMSFNYCTTVCVFCITTIFCLCWQKLLLKNIFQHMYLSLTAQFVVTGAGAAATWGSWRVRSSQLVVSTAMYAKPSNIKHNSKNWLWISSQTYQEFTLRRQSTFQSLFNECRKINCCIHLVICHLQSCRSMRKCISSFQHHLK